ncbi:uncharacterized protein LOC128549276 [Mercenaria mercenaria]|uniref:uncharacterized protein LOC128549276 n=1 Tax=Mercenaria mercenaria TaxID=6596 RepID=UPI00234EEAB0|nr:uncharacterized protein LOC128549276 [Mercenaria mercenaria]
MFYLYSVHGSIIPHITQISAVDYDSEDTFDQYVVPKMPITTTAQQVTGIVICGSNMTVNGSPVQSLPIKEALERFCKWLEKKPNVFLVAHNWRRFDFPVLMSIVKNVNFLECFFDCVIGLIDTLPVFKKVFPGQSHKQEDLVIRHLQTTYGAHNAIEDVVFLRKLLLFTKLSIQEIIHFSFSPKAMLNSVVFHREKARNIRSRDVLISSSVCKAATAENIAGSGLNLSRLQRIYSRDGEDGLQNTFTVKNSEGQPRVTSSKRVLETVIPKLADFFKNRE